MSDQFDVTILTNRRHGTLSIGVTKNLIRRAHEHNSKAVQGFTTKTLQPDMISRGLSISKSLAIRKLRSPEKNNSRNGDVTGRSHSSRRTTSIGTTCLYQSPTHDHRGDSSRLALALLAQPSLRWLRYLI
jgi:predicted GIY-YIG superfamily endonuclease